MSSRSVVNPIPLFCGLDGQPLAAGNVFFGKPNRDPREAPIQVFYDEAMRRPAEQPLRTRAGYVMSGGSPTALFAKEDYSVLLVDEAGRGVFYAPIASASPAGASHFLQAGRGTGPRDLHDKLRDVLSVKDFLCADGQLVQGDGVHDDTTGVHRAFDRAIALRARVYFPAGKYRLTAGYTNRETGADLALEGDNPNYSAGTGAHASGSCILLDSSRPGSYFYRQAASNELVASNLNFACSGFVLDRAFFVTSASSVKHTVENVAFTAVEQPFVYESGTYMQMSSYRNIRFTNSGSFHSRTTSLIATLVVIDNIDVEGILPSNSEKIVCNLSGMRNVQGRNVLIEPALPEPGWTALRIMQAFAPGWVRYPNATFDGLYIECTGHEPMHVVEQVGNHATYKDCHLNMTPGSTFRLDQAAHAEIHCMPMVGSSAFAVDKLFSFGDADSHVTLRAINTLNIGSAIHHPQILFESSALGSAHPYVGVSFDNLRSQVLWEFDGGFFEDGKVEAKVFGNSCWPSTDARYGRKLVIAPGAGGAINTIIQARLRQVLGAAGQFWVAVRLKLPPFTRGSIEVPFFVDGASIGAGRVFRPGDSGQEYTVVLPATVGKERAALAGFAINGRIEGSGNLEIFYAAIGVGRSLPNMPVPNYPRNVSTANATAPTAGTWAQGDHCRNALPTAGQPKGWYCVAAGTPGRWISEGAL